MLLAFLRLVRFPNLLIVALTQYFVFYFLIRPLFALAELSTALDYWHFAGLVISTMIIAACGYIINDLYDLDIDRRNKPGRMILERLMTVTTAWYLYWVLLLAGLFLSLYLAWYVQNIPLVLLYPLANGLLWLYAWRWKRGFLIGNLVVSFFCAFVAGIVWFAERLSFRTLVEERPSIALLLGSLLISYLGFAFLSTWFRELIKDLEDQEGDAADGCRTMPIVWGQRRSLFFTRLLGVLLISLELALGAYLLLQGSWIGSVLLLLTVFFPSVWAVWILRGAPTKDTYHQASQWAKFVMFAGIFLLPFMY
ncbi:MAG: geranylgeranylglycerol-phosphate geranylgeranyltransferase [Bacteroidota bacterium]